jgi:glutamine synthetase
MPTTNSYYRIGKGCWTGYAAGWKIEEKESPLRVCIDLRSRIITNVEFKLIDNTCNVYLALAAILWSGIDGIHQNMVLRDKDDKNLDLLPENLGDALDSLVQNKVLCNLLGEEVVKSYVAIRRDEMKVAKNQRKVDAILSEVHK